MDLTNPSRYCTADGAVARRWSVAQLVEGSRVSWPGPGTEPSRLRQRVRRCYPRELQTPTGEEAKEYGRNISQDPQRERSRTHEGWNIWRQRHIHRCSKKKEEQSGKASDVEKIRHRLPGFAIAVKPAHCTGTNVTHGHRPVLTNVVYAPFYLIDIDDSSTYHALRLACLQWPI